MYDFLIHKLSLQASAKRIPLNGAFELTSRCNLNCKMCYIHHQKEECIAAADELTADQWISLALEARDAGMLSLILTGGEVFIREDFKTIYENITRMGFKITIYSNGSLIDSNIVKWLGEIPPTSIVITLYGASAQSYDKLCGNAKAYYDVTGAIDLLLAKGIHVELKTTLTRDNKEDYNALLEYANKRGLHLDIVDYLFPIRAATNTACHCRLTPVELANYQLRIFETNKKAFESYQNDTKETQASEQISKPFEELSDKFINQLVDSQKKESAFSCNAGSSDFWITWDGRMLPCGVLEELSTLPMKTGFSKAWKELCNQCSKIPKCVECVSCDMNEFCDVCPAKLKAETGSYNRPAKYLCELAKLQKQNFTKQYIYDEYYYHNGG